MNYILNQSSEDVILSVKNVISSIDLFSLYVLFSHFRPRGVLIGICLFFLSLFMRTFERKYSLE